MSNLKTENQVVLQRRHQLQSDIEKESARLLEERSKSIAEIELKHKKKLEAYEDLYKKFDSEILNLEFNRNSLKSEIESKISELNKVHSSVGEVKQTIEQEKSKVTALVSEQTATKELIDDQMSKIIPLQEELSAIQSNIGVLVIEKAELLALIDDKKSEYQALIEVAERDLTTAKNRKSDIDRQIFESQEQFKREREDIAVRKLAADKRDDNLRAREYKVRRDEDMVSQNASLLDL